MNLKKYFNLKIVVGLIITIIGIVLFYYDFIPLICSTNPPFYNCSLSTWLILSIIPLILIIMLIWKALEKILQRIGKSTKILNVVMIIVLGFFIAYLSVAIWLTHYRIQPILPPIETTSIAKLKQSCIINNGNEFNKECEDKLIEMENLYLYPAKSDSPSDGFYLYDSDTYSTYSDSIDSDFFISIQLDQYIKVYTEDNLGLLNKIKNKVTALKKPIPVSIKGVIKSAQLCTQIPPCKFGLMIFLEDITFNEFYETGSDIYRNEKYGFEFQIPGYTALLDNQHVESFIKCTVEQEKNKFIICDKDGQSVEIFSKDPNQSLKQAIEEQFLQDSPSEMCWVEVNQSDNDDYLHAFIDYPLIEIAEDPNINPWGNRKFCSDYSKLNGVSGFMMDPEYPDRFAYFLIGHYALFTKDGKVWQSTFRFFDLK